MKEATRWERLSEVIEGLKEEAERIKAKLESAKGDRKIVHIALNPKVSNTYSLMMDFKKILKTFCPGEIPKSMVEPWHKAVCELIDSIKNTFGSFDSILNDETRQWDLYKVIIGDHSRGMSREEFGTETGKLIDLLNRDYIFNANTIALNKGLVPMANAPTAASSNRRGRPKAEGHDEVKLEILRMVKNLGYKRPKALEVLRHHADPKWKILLRGVSDDSWLRYVGAFVKAHPNWREMV